MHNAQIVFVGEGPGKTEDQQGLPFVGRAGQLLDRLLADNNILRSDVFVTNIVKCRPPLNRDPQEEELAACRPYLENQLKAINPKVVVTLGRHALMWFKHRGMISREHGQLSIHDGRFVLLHLYHPAAALRSGSIMDALTSDFQQIHKALIMALKLEVAKNKPLEPSTHAQDAPTDLGQQNTMF